MHPSVAANPDREDEALDAELDRHGRPVAEQSHAGDQNQGETEPYHPHAQQIDRRRHEGVARADAAAVRYYAHSVEQLRPGFYPQALRAELYDFGVMAHHAHDAVGEHPHEHGEEGHHRGAGGYGDPGEAAGGGFLTGSEALSDQCGGRVLHAVSRKVAEAFGYDGEGIRGDRDRAQRRHYDCGCDVCASRHEVLQPQRPADSESVGVYLPAAAGPQRLRPVLLGHPPVSSELPAGGEYVREQEETGAEHRKSCAYRGSRNSHAHPEDEYVVEQYVEHAHRDAGDAGYLGVAARHEGALTEHGELVGRQEHRIYAEIRRSVGAYLLRTSEPAGERAAEGNAEQGEQHADREHGDQTLAEYARGAPEVPGPAAVGDLHAESGAVGVAEAAEYPGGGADEPYRRRFRRTEPADHRRVYVAHQTHRKLGHY